MIKSQSLLKHTSVSDATYLSIWAEFFYLFMKKKPIAGGEKHNDFGFGITSILIIMNNGWLPLY